MKRLRILQTVCALASLLMLAACTQEQLADSDVQNLPEGAYPLTFTAMQGEPVASPQTRVSDYDDPDGSHKSKWTNGDRIKIVVSEGGNDMETTCTLDENGNITGYNPKLYWKTTQTSKINAWYSNIAGQATVTDNTVNLADQHSGLAYVLKAEEKTGVNYKSGSISLQFKHQLAKVRVKLVKGTYEGDLSNVTVKINSQYTSCTISNGTVTVSGTTGDITMHKTTSGSDTYYEANVVPGTLSATDAFQITADGKSTNATLTNGVTLTAGQLYEITVTVNKPAPTEYDLSTNTDITINDDKEYILTGSGTGHVTINGNATVTLNNATIEPSSAAAAIQINPNHTATLILEGTNTLTGGAGYSAIYPKEGSNVIIDGTGTLDVKGGYKCAGIGASEQGNAGTITIENGTIVARGGAGSAGIGAGYRNSCTGIKILGGDITSSHGDSWDGSRDIGCGSHGLITYIELANCTLHTRSISANTVTPSLSDTEALEKAGVKFVIP